MFNCRAVLLGIHPVYVASEIIRTYKSNTRVRSYLLLTPRRTYYFIGLEVMLTVLHFRINLVCYGDIQMTTTCILTLGLLGIALKVSLERILRY